MNPIVFIVEFLRKIKSLTEIEDICRTLLTTEMELANRLFYREEIQELCETVVRTEKIANPFDRIEENSFVSLSNYEYDNLSDEFKVENNEGEKLLNLDGKIYNLVLYQDNESEILSFQFDSEIQEAYHEFTNLYGGVAPLKSLYKENTVSVIPCVNCSSTNTTLVWSYNDGRLEYHCNECDTDFEVLYDDVIDSHSNVQTIEIIPELNLCCDYWYHNHQLNYAIFRDGKEIKTGTEKDIDSLQGRIDNFIEAWYSLVPGSLVIKTDDETKNFGIDKIVDDKAITLQGKHDLVALADAASNGQFKIIPPKICSLGEVKKFDRFLNNNLDSIEILEVDNEGEGFIDIKEFFVDTGQSILRTVTRAHLDKYIQDNNYTKV